MTALAAGQLVGMPTETVYGLAADATQPAAVARVFAAKGRPQFNPLIVHVADLAQAETVAVFDDLSRQLALAFWPGPLTLVLPRAPSCPVADLASGGLETVAVRVPAHPLAQALLRAFGRPLVAPSANRSGTPSPTTAAHVRADLGADVALVLDGGACAHGLESTVVWCLGGVIEILRPGHVGPDDLGVYGPVRDGLGDGRHSPGRLLRHYAPAKPLRLEVLTPHEDEAYLSFGAPSPFALSATGDITEAATRLFAQLRAADASPYPRIAVAPIPGGGLGDAINDRLRRAAGAVG